MWLELVPGDDRNDPLLKDASEAGFNLDGIMAIGLTPLTLRCSDQWLALFKKMADHFGYCWEFVLDAGQAEPQYPWQHKTGIVHFRKVG